MLTGDNAATARHMAGELHIDEVVSDVLPDEKASHVMKMEERGDKVAMVGDGVNDAPALACARVGISMKSGTELAMESSDIVLMKSNPAGVAEAVQLGRTTLLIIRQNLFWAFFYNIIGIPLAAGCLYPAFGLTLNPMIAAGAMSLSSLCVVFNSLRLRGFTPRLGRLGNRAASPPPAFPVQEGCSRAWASVRAWSPPPPSMRTSSSTRSSWLTSRRQEMVRLPADAF